MNPICQYPKLCFTNHNLPISGGVAITLWTLSPENCPATQTSAVLWLNGQARCRWVPFSNPECIYVLMGFLPTRRNLLLIYSWCILSGFFSPTFSLQQTWQILWQFSDRYRDYYCLNKRGKLGQMHAYIMEVSLNHCHYVNILLTLIVHFEINRFWIKYLYFI